MAVVWQGSLIPWIDPSGDPMVGAVVEFFNANTSTPQTTYLDASLSTAAGPAQRTANARGMFRALYLNPDPGRYRVRVTEADATLVWDVDEIDVPQSATYVPPTAGDTDPSLLVTTGMRMGYYGTSAPSGWVRAAGRTIGSPTSGASERANADCQALFLHLWSVDSTLVVSGGRGGTAAGDWAANKTIALPDYRDRVPAGLATMGNSDAGLVADSLMDGGETSSDLGATAGLDDVTLTSSQMPSHLHELGTLKMPNHGHPTLMNPVSNVDSDTNGGLMVRGLSGPVQKPAYTGTPTNALGQQIGGSGDIAITGAMATAGSGTAHTNMQPTIFELVIIKL
jgi:microcystin-dependent protein